MFIFRILHIMIGSGDVEQLKNLIKFGRDFVEKIVLYADFNLNQMFYWDIMKAKIHKKLN